MNKFKYSQQARRLVDLYYNEVMEVASSWDEDGPEAIDDIINDNTEFGVELECYTPNITRGTLRAEIRAYREISFMEDIESLSTDIMQEEDISFLHSVYCNNHIGGLASTQHELIDCPLLDRPREAVAEDNVSYLEDILRSYLNSHNGAQYLASRFNRLESNTRTRALALNYLVQNYPSWRCGRDGSVDYTQDEFVSPILSGEDGIREMRDFIHHLEQKNFRTNHTCGGHTSLNYNRGIGKATKLLSVMTLWGLLEPAIYQKDIGLRNNSDRYAQWISTRYNIPKLINQIPLMPAPNIVNALEENPLNKYNSLSIRSTLETGRVEFRGWAGSLDRDQWTAQVALGEAVIDASGRLSRDLASVRREFRKHSNDEDSILDLDKIKARTGYVGQCRCDNCRTIRTNHPELENDRNKAKWVPAYNEDRDELAELEEN